jgi:hypothetical protein
MFGNNMEEIRRHSENRMESLRVFSEGMWKGWEENTSRMAEKNIKE